MPGPIILRHECEHPRRLLRITAVLMSRCHTPRLGWRVPGRKSPVGPLPLILSERWRIAQLAQKLLTILSGTSALGYKPVGSKFSTCQNTEDVFQIANGAGSSCRSPSQPSVAEPLALTSPSLPGLSPCGEYSPSRDQEPGTRGRGTPPAP